MPWRQLPDGSYFDTNTGTLRGFDSAREQAGRLISAAAKLPPRQANMFPPLPTQKLVELPTPGGEKAIIDPKRDVLALNPFELGMGELPKKVLAIGGIIGAAWLACWINRQGKSKKA